MRKEVAFYGNNSRLGNFLLEKWCAKHHKKYHIHLIFDNENERQNFSNNVEIDSIVLAGRDLVNVLKACNIGHLIILDASKLLTLSYLKSRLSRNNISIYIEDTKFLKTHLDKYESNISLKKNRLPIPKFQLLPEFISNPKIEFPVIIKPNRGFASINVHKIDKKVELENLQIKIENRKNYIVQKYLKGKEFSCTVVRNKELNFISIERELVKEYTVSSRFKKEYNAHLKKWLPFLNNLKFQYALNIQYMLTIDGPKIFEINPRLGTAETHRFEYNFDALDLILSKRLCLKRNLKEGTYIQN